MTAARLVQALVAGLRTDLDSYRTLHATLEAQFQAALAHRSLQLAAIGDEIVRQCEPLQLRSEQRGELLRRLLGNAEASFEALAERLPDEMAQPIRDAWTPLASLARECKRLNQRNCALITSQFEIMQRVLGEEEALYAR